MARSGDAVTATTCGPSLILGFSPPCLGEFPLLVDRRNLLRRRVIQRSHEGFLATASTRAHEEDEHAAARIPCHAAGVGITPRSLDRDHQPVRFELTAQPDKGLEHVRRCSGIRAGVVPLAGDQLDSIGRHRTVITVEPPPEPSLLGLAVPDQYDVSIRQELREVVWHNHNPTSRGGMWDMRGMGETRARP